LRIGRVNHPRALSWGMNSKGGLLERLRVREESARGITVRPAEIGRSKRR